MRIGTWNLERLRRGARCSGAYDEALASLRADLVIVTEPGPGFRERHPLSSVSPEERPGRGGKEAWVAIVGTSLQAVDLDIAYHLLAVACRTVLDETSVVVYGSVLPWLSARTHAPDVYGDMPRPFIEIFATVLGEQVEDMRELRLRYPDEALVWAGDFNNTLMGRALQREASAMLQRAVEDLGLKVTNAAAPHRQAGIRALDLICIQESWTCTAVETGFPLLGDRALSDHCSYVSLVTT